MPHSLLMALSVVVTIGLLISLVWLIFALVHERRSRIATVLREGSASTVDRRRHAGVE